MAESHRLEIVKPGRGAWMAQCSCGEPYKQKSQANPDGSRYWTPSEVSKAKIKQMHDNHKSQVKVSRSLQEADRAIHQAEKTIRAARPRRDQRMRTRDIDPRIIFDIATGDSERDRDIEDAFTRRLINETGDPSLPPVPPRAPRPTRRTRQAPPPAPVPDAKIPAWDDVWNPATKNTWHWKPGRQPGESLRDHRNRRSIENFLQYRDKSMADMTQGELLRLDNDVFWQKYRRENGLDLPKKKRR